MTRKDYLLIASAIKLTATDIDECSIGTLALLAGVITRVGAALASENPRFDKARFYRDCGLHHTGKLPMVIA